MEYKLGQLTATMFNCNFLDMQLKGDLYRDYCKSFL